MSEELLQRDLLKNPGRIGEWLFYSLGATNINDLKKHNIVPDRDYKKISNKKPDALVTDGKKVIAVVEYKKPSELRTKRQEKKAIDQEIDVTRDLGAKLLIVTDTKKTIWVNVLNGERISDEKGNLLQDIFDPKDRKIAKTISKIISSLSKDNSQIKPAELINPTPLAKKIWQDIWAASGAPPENCLYTFVEIFIFKYLSDLQVLTGIHSFDRVFEMYKEHPEGEVLEFYAGTVRKKIKELFPKNNVDNTTIINGTIFVSKDEKAVKGYSTVFKRILQRFSEYGKLENIDHDFKSQLFESFLKESISKKNWGQYFTPYRVVKAVVKMADIREGDYICDQACGVGKFLLQSIGDELDKYYEVNGDEIISKINLIGYDKGFDHDEQKTIILAKANMLIYFSDLIKEHTQITKNFAKLLNKTFVLKTHSILGTLADPIEEKFDWILSNPPYVTSGSSNLKEAISDMGLESYYKINASGAEGLFVEWIINALKKGGKAFVIVPDGIMLRKNLKKLRQFIVNECEIENIISLPSKTFFTTSKRTYILGLTKKHAISTPQTHPVLCYLVSEIGESRDINRFEIDEDHLTDAVNQFNQFKGAKNYYTTNDSRCKIIPIEKFIKDTDNWMIEKFWSKKEKIKLGIEEEKQQVTLDKFIGEFENLKIFLNDSINELNELQKENSEKVKFKDVSILDENVFEMTRGKRITKTIINSNKGKVPVFSSSKDSRSALGYVDEKYLKKEGKILFEKPAVLFNLDGSVGKCFVKSESKYSFIDVVAAIRPVRGDIDLEYLKIKLEEAIVKTGSSYQTKLYFHKIENLNLKIKIPVNKDGSFNVDLQKKISTKQKDVDKIKQEFIKRAMQISEINIALSV